MTRTPEQKELIKEIYAKLRKVFPDFYGSVTFNLNPKKKDVSINVNEHIIEDS